jgi:hypothetical protein
VVVAAFVFADYAAEDFIVADLVDEVAAGAGDVAF